MSGSRRGEARRWFRQSGHDLRAVEWNIEGGFHSTACFLAQQAAEKALKSLLYFRGARRSALLTHSLVEMLGEIRRENPTVESLMEAARTLDLHYIPSRYPNGLPAGYPHEFYGKDTALNALAAAQAIFGFVMLQYQAENAEDML